MYVFLSALKISRHRLVSLASLSLSLSLSLLSLSLWRRRSKKQYARRVEGQLTHQQLINDRSSIKPFFMQRTTKVFCFFLRFFFVSPPFLKKHFDIIKSSNRTNEPSPLSQRKDARAREGCNHGHINPSDECERGPITRCRSHLLRGGTLHRNASQDHLDSHPLLPKRA